MHARVARLFINFSLLYSPQRILAKAVREIRSLVTAGSGENLMNARRRLYDAMIILLEIISIEIRTSPTLRKRASRGFNLYQPRVIPEDA